MTKNSKRSNRPATKKIIARATKQKRRVFKSHTRRGYGE